MRYTDILGIIGQRQEEREGVSLPRGALLCCCAEAWQGWLFSVVYMNLKGKDYLNPHLVPQTSFTPALASHPLWKMK